MSDWQNMFKHVSLNQPANFIRWMALTLAVIMIAASSSKVSIAAPNSCTSPDLIYSTLIGGSGRDEASAISLDGSGSVYLSGTSFSTVFPSRAAQHGVDAMTLKLNPTATNLDSLLWINPNPLLADDTDYGYDVGHDAAGNSYVVGGTNSTDFCSFLGVATGVDTTHNGSSDGYILKVNADGSTIDYCTYIGGSDADAIRAISVQPDGSVYVTGDTWSADFPTTTGPSSAILRDSFVLKLNAAGNAIEYSTLFGGAQQEAGTDIVVNASGEAHVVGWTNSADLPISAAAYSQTYGGSFDTFALKLSSDGQTRQYATYLGGSLDDRATGADLDALGNLFIVGSTYSPAFPTTASALKATYSDTSANPAEIFVTQLSATGSQVLYSTFFGGEGWDRAEAVVVQPSGDIYVTGRTQSPDLLVSADSIQPTLNGSEDAFLLRFKTSSTTPIYSTYWGGSDADHARDLAVDSNGNVYLAGLARSADFCTTSGTVGQTPNGDYDIFVTKLKAGTPSQIAANVYLPIVVK